MSTIPQLLKPALPRSIPVLVSILVILSCLLVSGCGHNHEAGVGRTSPGLASFQGSLDKKGVLDTSDATKLNSISVQLASKHVLTDADLDFWINLLKHGPPKDDVMNRYQFYAIVMGDLDNKMNLTPSQRDKLYAAILPYVYTTTYQSWKSQANPQTAAQLMAGTQLLAMQILAHTKDARVD